MVKRASKYTQLRFIIILLILFPTISFAKNEDYRGTLLSSSNSAVFYIGNDNKKYNFIDTETYLSWFDKFDYVKKVDESIINSFELGGMVRYKPGKYENNIKNLPTGTIAKKINCVIYSLY